MGKTNQSTYSNEYRKTKSAVHNRNQKMIGNVAEGHGYADKRKRKILSTFKKMIRKTRTAEPQIGSDDQPGLARGTKGPGVNSTDGRISQETTHYTKNSKQQAHQQKNRYVKAKHKASLQNVKMAPVSRYTQVERQRQKLTREHQEKLQVKKASRETREDALRKYRETKEARHRKLSKRTPKGQPIIKYQMEYLLEKIQLQNVQGLATQ